MDRRGKIINMEFMHKPSGILINQHKRIGESVIPSNTTGDGIVPIILGYIYGMQFNKNGASNCFQAVELNLIVIDEILAYVQ